MLRNVRLSLLLVLAGALAALPAVATGPLAEVDVGATAITFLPTKGFGNAGYLLKVSGPDGAVHEERFVRGATPSFSLFDDFGDLRPDGAYTWELVAIPANRVRGSDDPAVTRMQSGSFTVAGGSIVAGGEEEAARPGANPKPMTGVPLKDQVILDDLIVDGSICAGLDCVNGESFGFDTLRLKENNLRIKFQDTSSSASFPTNDWQITINDSSNGGQNKFSIDDIDGGRTPFTIEASAPSHSLYVDDGGRIGFGTSTPVVELHVVDGDTPTLRLEQDGSSGFTPQTFDVAANETNFFIRDATNGSTLPFRIRPGAPTSAIDVAGSGDVGIGTSSPGAELHVRRTDANRVELRLESAAASNQAAAVRMINAAATWEFQTDTSGNLLWRDVTPNVNPVVIEPNTSPAAGESVIRVESSNRVGINVGNNQATEALYVDGNIFATGTITPMSDATMKEDFAAVDYDDVLAAVAELNISTWAYKTEPGVRHMGPTLQDFRAAFSELGKPESRGIATADLDGVALAAIKALHQKLQQRDAEIEALRQQMAELQSTLQALAASSSTK
ncbi:MAG: hypothetical protein D6696_20480 [Acidobacteria bacterium]|nr:MAG: hypothetical protein D6696_20480 [Acidobacteriota bacterium]